MNTPTENREIIRQTLLDMFDEEGHYLSTPMENRLVEYVYTLLYTTPPVWTLQDLVDKVVDTQSILTDTLGGRKIVAIKSLRELTGCGLKEAKDAVERVESQLDFVKHTLKSEPPF